MLALSWRIAWLGALMPPVLADILYPISKTDLDPLRLMHFAALSYVVLYYVGKDAGWLSGWVARPIVTCGRQSLQVFCLGIILSFTGQTILVQFNDSLLAQLATTVLGIGAMVMVARILTWYQKAERQPRRSVRRRRMPGHDPQVLVSSSGRPVDRGVSPALAQEAPPESCAIPDTVLTIDAVLPKVRAALQDGGALTVLVVRTANPQSYPRRHDLSGPPGSGVETADAEP